MTSRFDKDFWTAKYRANELGWDMGSVSPPIKNYIDQLEDRDISILIPGAGNAYEAEYLHNEGFSDVDVLDISADPLKNLSLRVPDFPEEHLIQSDFFEWQRTYDLILEQTFFCALDPKLRQAYAKKMNDLLNPGGKLVGLFFDFPLTEAGPPFGGHYKEYVSTFEKWFDIRVLERCHNSIKPRLGKELFLIFEKKINLNE
jgi:thiopurine S-methyltransferase